MDKSFLKFLRSSFLNKPLFWILVAIIFIYSKEYFSITLLILPAIFCLILAMFREKNLILRIIILCVWLLTLFFFGNAYSKLELLKLNSNSKLICGIVRENDYEKKTLKLFNISLNGKRVLSDLIISGVENKEIQRLSSVCIKSKLEITKFSYFQTKIVIDQKEIVKSERNFVSVFINFLSSRLNDSTNYYLKENADIFKAIVFGIQDDLDSEQKKEFRDLGLSHVLVASGANIILILTAIKASIGRLKFKNKAVLEFIIVLAYLLIVGIEGSITRAFLFFLINLFSQTYGREIGFIHKIVLSVVLFTLIFPEIIVGFSFILSMSAVLSLKISGDLSTYLDIKSKYVRFIIQNISVITIVGLISAFYFKNYNLTGLISNMIVLPLIEIIVLLGFFGGIVFLIAYGLNIRFVQYLIEVLANVLKILLDIVLAINSLLQTYIGDKFIYKFSLYSEDLLLLLLLILISWIYLNYQNFLKSISMSRRFNESEVENLLV